MTAVLGLLCLAILLSLGFWQLDRREWKGNLLAVISDRLETLAEPLPEAPGQDWEYRRVLVSGAVVPGSWFRFPGRSRGGKVGDLLMLLIRDETGRLIVVEQAFIDFGGELPPLPAAVAREGILRPPGQSGWVTPSNDVAANQWYTVDPAAMAAAVSAGQGTVMPFYVVSKDWEPDIPNDHLQYALTWFSFAAIFVIIFTLFHRRKA